MSHSTHTKIFSWKKKKILTFTSSLIFFTSVSLYGQPFLHHFTIAKAWAVSKPSPKIAYQAFPLIQSEKEVRLKPDEVRKFKIGFKNVGALTLTSTKKQPITLRSDAKRESYFSDQSWLSGVTVLENRQAVTPGRLFYIEFFLHAPLKTGQYSEAFSLYRGKEKIKDSDVVLPIEVATAVAIKQNTPVSRQIKNLEAIVVPPVVLSQPEKGVATLAAIKLIQSDTSLTMSQNGRIAFTVGFKNTSAIRWTPDMAPQITLRSLVKRESYFYDPTWKSGNVVMALKGEGAPGEIVYFQFLLNAPFKPGMFQERLALFSGDTKLFNTDVAIPILVTQEKTQATLASYTQTPAPTPAPQPTIQGVPQQNSTNTPPVPPLSSTPFVPVGIVNDIQEMEPSLRIGIFTSNDPIQITAQRDYDVRDTAGTLLASQQAGTVVTVSYDRATRMYSVLTSQASSTTMLPVRFSASKTQLTKSRVTSAALETATSSPTLTSSTSTQASPPTTAQPSLEAVQAPDDAVFTVLSYSNRPSWSTSINDNAFRSLLEIRYTQATDKIWMVNELSLEQYLKGIAETSNNSPQEYQKALIIAARTYALYHIKRSTKYASENFTMRGTDADQVYRGYNAETRLPNVTRAVQDTRGAIVTYNGQLAITPYYSQSDGRTRSWEEVWGGGPKAWLVGKPDPCCTGLKMLGHGVGMSARGALLLALEGKGFEEILKYYYTGIEIRRKY